ncbi:MAG TPA: serine hydrolase domain-containing protein [Caulobacteraceae bacterium]|jgi:CubicO group peptidase (beta-lactamase class C family)|nr:serine hydrolase domain-containing protein [Caulobacteraceae bacterium]
MASRIDIVGLFASAALALAPAAHPQSVDFQSRFDGELDRHGIVGGGFVVVRGQEPARMGFHGLARQQTRQAVDADTAWNWASITKTFTAIAILQLRDRGLLSLDDPAVKYVPELREVHDAYGPIEAVTIRTLLTHSAGFRNPTWPWDCDDARGCDWQPFEPTRWTQVAAMLPYTHVDFAPGSKWSYSNPGYVFLGQIIERLSGDDFEVYVDKNILKPLGMADSYFDRAPYFLQSHVAASYLRGGRAGKLQDQPLDFDTGVTTSNSGLKAPLNDMVKYLRFLIGEPGNPLYEAVLKRSTLEEMWRGLVPISADGAEMASYKQGPHGEPEKMGLGFFTFEARGRPFVFHDGDQGGFSSELIVDPGDHAAALLVINTTDTGKPPRDAGHVDPNSDPDPRTDLRVALRRVLVDEVFAPAQSPPGQ